MMKRYFMTLVAIVCSTMATQAQSSWADCATVQKVVFRNQWRFTQDYDVVDNPYNGEVDNPWKDSLSVGIVSIEIWLLADESTYSLRKGLEIPNNTFATFSLTNIYGEMHHNGESDLKSFYDKAVRGFAKKINQTANTVINVIRGGQYTFQVDIEALNYKETRNLIINGSAGFDFCDKKTINCGKDTVLRVTCNTGYPYDYSSLNGDEYAKATVYRINDDDTETELHSHEISLPFKQANQPLMAQIDTLFIGFEKPEVGKYRVHLESNWEGLKERSAIITVIDPSATGINVFKADSTNGRNDEENTYTLNGMKVGKGTKQPKGIYIRKGRKYINR